jgi:hypothetical protein
MDNISGTTLFDESPNDNDGVITGATSVPGKIGNALSFDGINDVVQTGYLGATDTQGAVSFWATREDTGFNTIIGKGNSAVDADLLVIQVFPFSTSGQIRVVVDSGGVTDIARTTGSSIPVSSSNFFHCVVQSNGSSWEFWVDGVQRTLALDAGTNSGRWFGDVGNKDASIGGLDRLNPVYNKSKVDQVRFYDRPLTADEISELYNGGAGA